MEIILYMYHINIEENNTEEAIIKAGNKLRHLYVEKIIESLGVKVVTCHRMKK